MLKRFLSLLIVLGVLSGVPAYAASVGDAMPGTKKQFKLTAPKQKKKTVNCKSKKAQRKNKRCQGISQDSYNR